MLDAQVPDTPSSDPPVGLQEVPGVGRSVAGGIEPVASHHHQDAAGHLEPPGRAGSNVAMGAT